MDSAGSRGDLAPLRFRSSLFAKVLLAAVLLLVALARGIGLLRDLSTDPEAMARTVGEFAGSLFAVVLWFGMAWLLGWVVFRIGGRSRRAAAWGRGVLTVVMVFLLLGALGNTLDWMRGSAGGRVDRATIAQIEAIGRDAERERSRTMLRSISEAPPSVEETLSEASSISAETFRRMEDAAGDNEVLAAGLRAAQRAIAPQESLAAEYVRIMNELERDGAWDAATYDSPERLDAVIAGLNQAVQVFDRLDGLRNAMPDAVEKDMLAQGVRPGLAADFCDGVRRGIQDSRESRVHRLEGEILVLLRESRLLLRQSWGAWSVDPESGEIHFDDPAEEVMRRYNAAIDEALEVSQRQEALLIEAARP
jgi:hypothetical protein